MREEQNNNVSNAIYISGRMSGIKEYNYDGFKKAELLLKKKFPDRVIINPMDLILQMYTMKQLLNNEYDYDLILSTVLQTLRDKCNTIYMLKGWELSNGARKELKTAIALRHLVYFEQDNIEENK